jgi:hypothetical protein
MLELSMSDLFHEDVPLEYIQRVFDVMRRADRLAELDAKLEWAPNICMGVSVESDKYRSRIGGESGPREGRGRVSMEFGSERQVQEWLGVRSVAAKGSASSPTPSQWSGRSGATTRQRSARYRIAPWRSSGWDRYHHPSERPPAPAAAMIASTTSTRPQGGSSVRTATRPRTGAGVDGGRAGPECSFQSGRLSSRRRARSRARRSRPNLSRAASATASPGFVEPFPMVPELQPFHARALRAEAVDHLVLDQLELCVEVVLPRGERVEALLDARERRREGLHGVGYGMQAAP